MTTNNQNNVNIVKSKDNKFPLIAIIVIIAEFCERFSYSGMKAFLTLYLKNKLMYSDDEATEIYHAFTSSIYFFPILGAIVADNYLGKFKTIVWMMFVYAAGNIVIALTAIPVLGMPARICTMLGLLLIGIGAGGIKPCVAAFGGDQFKIPSQEKYLAMYFSILYFGFCFGSLLSKTISPLLRSEIQCFGDKECYPIAFGAPGIIMLSSIAIFVGAKRYYNIKKPTGNIIIEVIKCIMLGIKNKLASQSDCNDHWLDSTKNKFNEDFVNDVKKTMSILVLYIPLPVFWALLDQMGSRWTLQASRMDGDFYIFRMRPDQVQVLAPFLLVCLIPLFQKVLYPCLEKINILTNPLHKLMIGGILAGLAFVVSGCIELHLQGSYPELPQKNFSQIRIFNGNPCPITINNTAENIFVTIPSYSVYTNKRIEVNGSKNLTMDLNCDCFTFYPTQLFLLEENEAVSFYMTGKNVLRYTERIAKSRSGFPLVRFIKNTTDDGGSYSDAIFYNDKRKENELTISQNGVSEIFEVYPSTYSILINNKTIQKNIQLRNGGVYTVILQKPGNNSHIVNVIVITSPNSISMALLIPQFILVSVGEVFFGVTGLEFSFKEAPETMKSVIQASWLLTEAFGNVLIIIVTRLAVSCAQSTQSFIYSFLMFFSMVIFYFLLKRYKFSSICYIDDSSSLADIPETKRLRRSSEVLYMQVKQYEDIVEH